MNNSELLRGFYLYVKGATPFECHPAFDCSTVGDEGQRPKVPDNTVAYRPMHLASLTVLVVHPNIINHCPAILVERSQSTHWHTRRFPRLSRVLTCNGTGDFRRPRSIGTSIGK